MASKYAPTEDSDFKYRLLTNKFKSNEGQPTDVGVNPIARRVEK